MKKILSIIAALAMVGAFVGCDIEGTPKSEEFVFDNDQIIYQGKGKSAYPIQRVVMTQNDHLDYIISNDKVDGYPTVPRFVTLKSTPGADTITVDFYSDLYAKKATSIRVSVSEYGSISGLYDLQNFQYYGEFPLWSTGPWTDNPGANVANMSDGTYKDDSDTKRSLVVKGNIVYQIYSDHYFRTIFSADDDDVLSVEEDTFGYVNAASGRYEQERLSTPDDKSRYNFVDFNGFTVIAVGNSLSFAKTSDTYSFTKQ